MNLYGATLRRKDQPQWRILVEIEIEGESQHDALKNLERHFDMRDWCADFRTIKEGVNYGNS